MPVSGAVTPEKGGSGVPQPGLGIITYNRRAALQGCLRAVREHTRTPYHLVVADDGSSDGSVEWARGQGITTITGQRRGVVWNRNRALAYLLEGTDCDPIILLEDDGWPAAPAWEQAWIEAAARWGHVSYALGIPELILGGRGTAQEPFLCRVFGGVCTATTRAALQEVGYLDTRFQGYGYGHIEWTQRFLRLLAPRWEAPIAARGELLCPCLRSRLYEASVGSWFDAKERKRNRRVMKQVRGEPIWRAPARDAMEAAILRRELEAGAGISRAWS